MVVVARRPVPVVPDDCRRDSLARHEIEPCIVGRYIAPRNDPFRGRPTAVVNAHSALQVAYQTRRALLTCEESYAKESPLLAENFPSTLAPRIEWSLP